MWVSGVRVWLGQNVVSETEFRTRGLYAPACLLESWPPRPPSFSVEQFLSWNSSWPDQVDPLSPLIPGLIQNLSLSIPDLIYKIMFGWTGTHT